MFGDANYIRGEIAGRQASGQSVQQGDWASAVGQWWNTINGTAANNAFNAQQAEQERIFNAAEAARQREHELYMSNSAYQRAAADMRAAGINPASLSGLASGGSAASSSSSSAASASHAASGSGSSGPAGIIQSLIGLVGLLGVGALRVSAAKNARKVIWLK